MTSRILLLSLLLIVSSLPGCVPDRPQYVKNWEGLRVGMTKSEVTELLGLADRP